jgi:hypothetical protein
MVAPYHLYVVAHPDADWPEAKAALLLGGGVVLGLALGAAAVAVPLRVGGQALRRMEF